MVAGVRKNEVKTRPSASQTWLQHRSGQEVVIQTSLGVSGSHQLNISDVVQKGWGADVG